MTITVERITATDMFKANMGNYGVVVFDEYSIEGEKLYLLHPSHQHRHPTFLLAKSKREEFEAAFVAAGGVL